MPQRWKHKPWKPLFGLLFITIGLPIFGMDLFDGDITLRRFGHVTAYGTPAKYVFVSAMYFVSVALTAAGWFLFVQEWRTDYRPRVKPEFDDPSKRSTL